LVSGFSLANTLSKFLFILFFLSSPTACIKLQGEESLQRMWAVITNVKSPFCHSDKRVLC
jgi:hypothetical protein